MENFLPGSFDDFGKDINILPIHRGIKTAKHPKRLCSLSRHGASHKWVSALESKSLNLKAATLRSFTFYVPESMGESLKVIKFKWRPLGTRKWAFRIGQFIQFQSC